jgi:hypothetical protein
MHIWFAGVELSEEQEKGLSKEVEACMAAHLTSLQSQSHKHSSDTTASTGGALIVNPLNNKVTEAH